ncbi:uncharacterized protein RHOBADRAFT_51695 [Rhodotorula graminis WP1]|uniref:Uncharacterized protein n=1 Tax=Rhodotorula graminis (strain WP1) TaxID=578459 RepID=A0A194S880_RHOGW|nr:uncharacterized protein RHOBADRAFT_51695 [Rhodotorula graminis WP1]KPV76690.1 hypothetical protein RHOBADRAFT_51695 [Rhodotorula graminis WP1]
MSAHDSYSSDSGSDSDDAPEVVSLSAARQGTKADQRRRLEEQQRLNRAKKSAGRERAAASSRKGKGRAAEEDEDEEAHDDDEDLEEDGEELGAAEEELEDDAAPAPVAPQGTKTTYLDDSLFADAAAHYEAGKHEPAPGQGKKAAKRRVKEERQRRREEAERRAGEVGVGGKTQVGDLTLQHLPTVAHGPASLSSTALPSHTSATKFLTSRLYSKKRQVAVLDAGRADASQPRNPKKSKGMSFESKVLLGLADPEDANVEKDKERKRKKALLLQAEGTRKSAATARPLASARRGAQPANNFAQSSFRG